jgi:hypothetical protein
LSLIKMECQLQNLPCHQNLLFGVDTPFLFAQADVVSKVKPMPEPVARQRHTFERLIDDHRC